MRVPTSTPVRFAALLRKRRGRQQHTGGTARRRPTPGGHSNSKQGKTDTRTTIGESTSQPRRSWTTTLRISKSGASANRDLTRSVLARHIVTTVSCRHVELEPVHTTADRTPESDHGVRSESARGWSQCQRERLGEREKQQRSRKTPTHVLMCDLPFLFACSPSRCVHLVPPESPSPCRQSMHEDHHHQRGDSMESPNGGRVRNSRSNSIDTDDALILELRGKAQRKSSIDYTILTKSSPNASQWTTDKRLYSNTFDDSSDDGSDESPSEAPSVQASRAASPVKLEGEQKEGRLLIVANRLPVSMKVTKKMGSDGKEHNDVSRKHA